MRRLASDENNETSTSIDQDDECASGIHSFFSACVLQLRELALSAGSGSSGGSKDVDLVVAKDALLQDGLSSSSPEFQRIHRAALLLSSSLPALSFQPTSVDNSALSDKLGVDFGDAKGGGGGLLFPLDRSLRRGLSKGAGGSGSREDQRLTRDASSGRIIGPRLKVRDLLSDSEPSRGGDDSVAGSLTSWPTAAKRGGSLRLSSESDSGSLQNGLTSSSQHNNNNGGGSLLSSSANGAVVVDDAGSLSMMEGIAREALERLRCHPSEEDHVQSWLQALAHSGSSEAIHREKRRVKSELRKYDLFFRQRFGRLPEKNEKEPMRAAYVYYRQLKSVLTKLEAEASAANRRDRDKRLTTAVNGTANSEPRGGDSKGGGGGATTLTASSAAELELQRIIPEKNAVCRRLQKFQEEFIAHNGRPIKYHRDIVAVEDEYARYKSLRETARKLQDKIEQEKAG